MERKDSKEERSEERRRKRETETETETETRMHEGLSVTCETLVTM